jgi:hypothetical protein
MNRAHCLENIRAVREAIKDPDSAYLVRTRLKRTTLSCARLIAMHCGCSPPELPGPFHAPPGASMELQNICGVCNRIYNSTSNICQPSEPLELRWRNAWSALEDDLQSLESMVQALPDLT